MQASFFTHNRRALYKALASDGWLVLSAHHALQKVGDEAYDFAQEPNFWYLTGIEEADWLFVADLQTGEEWLLAPEVLKTQQLFDGALSPQQARHASGIEAVIDKKAGQQLLKKVAVSGRIVHTLGLQPRKYYGVYANPAQRDLRQQLRGAHFDDIRLTLAKQRAIKQPAEIVAIQQAIDITVEGAKHMVAELPQLQHEFEAEARLNFEFRRRGLNHAFRPIIAAGKNACTIHSMNNNGPLHKKDWLLFDIGARADGYAADLGRSLPLGTPTQRQRDMFSGLQQVQEFAIGLLTPGRNVADYMYEVEQALHRYFVDFGLLRKKDPREKIYTIMPHAIGHGLGIEVHDALGRPETFAEHMVMTVEPGVYLPDEGFGLRIEDDILITADGPQIMSAGLPRTFDELIQLRG